MRSGHLLRWPHRLSAAGFSSFIQRTMPRPCSFRDLKSRGRKGWRTWGSVCPGGVSCCSSSVFMP